MIPVTPQPEPRNFDRLVRQPGLNYLHLHPDTKPSRLPAYWRKVIHELWEKYDGICAYLAKYLPEPTGAVTTDHFVAKSKSKELAYEWSNYRLASLGRNRKKNTDRVLDPFRMEPESFFINFANGEMYPNPSKKKTYRDLCEKTIKLLDLNSASCKRMRVKDYEAYKKQHVDLCFLKSDSPFVYAEIIRQQLQ